MIEELDELVSEFTDPTCFLDEIGAAKFWLKEELPLISLIVLMGLDTENEEERAESRLKLMAWQHEEFLEQLLTTISDIDEPRLNELLAKANQALKNGEITIPCGQRLNETSPSYTIVDSISFLNWWEKQGLPIEQDIKQSAKLALFFKLGRERIDREFEKNFPKLSEGEFSQLQKEPLWQVRNAIIYLLGRKSMSSDVELERYFKNDEVASSIIKYLMDTIITGDLQLYGSGDETQLAGQNIDAILHLKVRPKDFIEWAQVLPINLASMSEASKGEPDLELTDLEIKQPHRIAEMLLADDAIKEFWSDYDFENPDPNIAPYKRNVVAWLLEQAKVRGIPNFSKSKANAIDTLIRCPKARQGGNTR